MEPDEKIICLRTEIHEKERYEKQLKDVKAEYKAKEAKEKLLQEALTREEQDVKRLESLSFRNFWYSLIGSKSEKLSQEKRESYQAGYEYQKNRNAKENLAKEIATLEARLAHLQKSAAVLDALLIQKEESILLTESHLSQRIRDIIKSLSGYRIANQELSEAIAAGNDLLTHLYEVQKNLRYAGSYHRLHHQGIGYTQLSFSLQLHHALTGFSDLKYYTDCFRRELKDVNPDLCGKISFTDDLFDLMYIGITKHFEISAAAQRLETLLLYIQSIIGTLGDKKRDNEKAMSALTETKKQLLEVASVN